MMNTAKNKLPVMSDKCIAELKNFRTKYFTACPVQTPEQLREFKPKSEMLGQITAENIHDEIETGAVTGNEIW